MEKYFCVWTFIRSELYNFFAFTALEKQNEYQK